MANFVWEQDELNPSLRLLSGQDGNLINCCFPQASGALYAMQWIFSWPSKPLRSQLLKSVLFDEKI